MLGGGGQGVGYQAASSADNGHLAVAHTGFGTKLGALAVLSPGPAAGERLPEQSRTTPPRTIDSCCHVLALRLPPSLCRRPTGSSRQTGASDRGPVALSRRVASRIVAAARIEMWRRGGA